MIPYEGQNHSIMPFTNAEEHASSYRAASTRGSEYITSVSLSEVKLNIINYTNTLP